MRVFLQTRPKLQWVKSHNLGRTSTYSRSVRSWNRSRQTACGFYSLSLGDSYCKWQTFMYQKDIYLINGHFNSRVQIQLWCLLSVVSIPVIFLIQHTGIIAGKYRKYLYQIRTEIWNISEDTWYMPRYWLGTSEVVFGDDLATEIAE
jgi:hypothetical protein